MCGGRTIEGGVGGYRLTRRREAITLMSRPKRWLRDSLEVVQPGRMKSGASGHLV
jgi:hypothetical protein